MTVPSEWHEIMTKRWAHRRDSHTSQVTFHSAAGNKHSDRTTSLSMTNAQRKAAGVYFWIWYGITYFAYDIMYDTLYHSSLIISLVS